MAKRATGDDGNDSGQSFEDALGELEEITRRMESGDVPLDESLRLYERGTKLVKTCQGRLDAAERKIEELSRGEGGQLASTGGRGREGGE